mmetsp:Transcript_8886/g.27583  ORF Transcript_8886/g.27583 Transcript_8886/m.27583 type:complete len:649 (-) Transcript_8886:197-2143(-)
MGWWCLVSHCTSEGAGVPAPERLVVRAREVVPRGGHRQRGFRRCERHCLDDRARGQRCCSVRRGARGNCGLRWRFVQLHVRRGARGHLRCSALRPLGGLLLLPLLHPSEAARAAGSVAVVVLRPRPCRHRLRGARGPRPLLRRRTVVLLAAAGVVVAGADRRVLCKGDEARFEVAMAGGVEYVGAEQVVVDKVGGEVAQQLLVAARRLRDLDDVRVAPVGDDGRRIVGVAVAALRRGAADVDEVVRARRAPLEAVLEDGMHGAVGGIVDAEDGVGKGVEFRLLRRDDGLVLLLGRLRLGALLPEGALERRAALLENAVARLPLGCRRRGALDAAIVAALSRLGGGELRKAVHEKHVLARHLRRAVDESRAPLLRDGVFAVEQPPACGLHFAAHGLQLRSDLAQEIAACVLEVGGGAGEQRVGFLRLFEDALQVAKLRRHGAVRGAPGVHGGLAQLRQRLLEGAAADAGFEVRLGGLELGHVQRLRRGRAVAEQPLQLPGRRVSNGAAQRLPRAGFDPAGRAVAAAEAGSRRGRRRRAAWAKQFGHTAEGRGAAVAHCQALLRVARDGERIVRGHFQLLRVLARGDERPARELELARAADVVALARHAFFKEALLHPRPTERALRHLAAGTELVAEGAVLGLELGHLQL